MYKIFPDSSGFAGMMKLWRAAVRLSTVRPGEVTGEWTASVKVEARELKRS